MYELILTEKPSVSRRIASALADGPIEENKDYGVSYFRITRGGKEYLVLSAVGHLYSLKQKTSTWTYPVFDIEWVPIWETNKSASYTKPYINTIRELSKGATGFYLSTDYDTEGELIGHNILLLACPKGALKKTKRLKFSTLTKDELVKAFEGAKSPDHGLAEAGETRHRLDWIYGINLSRALTHSLRKASGSFLTLSSGRVQGPALKILVDREREIRKFIPEKYWQLELRYEKDGAYSAFHKKDRLKEKPIAEEILRKCTGQPATVASTEKRQFNQSPPTPFDLTTLQTEAYKVFKFKPKFTQQLAQTLYERALISYPRTASQKLPAVLGYKELLQKLGKNPIYSSLVEGLIKNKLTPNEGKASDPAHPAIYPTGETPSGLSKEEHSLYDLIARRFMATFGKPAVRETMTVELDVNSEIFVGKGTRTVEKNWHKFYEPYLNLEEEKIPELSKGETLKVLDLILHEKETQPPKHYTAASIIRELERLGLGTKATRADIVSKLESRQYVSGANLQVTALGINVIETLEKYCPQIIDPALTRKFEDEMEKIQGGKLSGESVFLDAKETLTKILEQFKKEELKIGEGLKESYIHMKQVKKEIGTCPECSDILRIIKAKASGKRFVGCSGYPKCTYSMPLPQKGTIRPTKSKCPTCNAPIVNVIKKGSKPWRLCINIDCPSKKKISKKADPPETDKAPTISSTPAPNTHAQAAG